MAKVVTRRSRSSGGFALVASLSLMVLLTVLAVGLLGLASIELRGANQNGDLAAARANARLALIEAIGQLQRHAGADQRVTATGDILGSVAHPHWTGVWTTKSPLGDATWTRDGETGSLRDRRAARETREAPVAWLVSGTANVNDTLADARSVELVGDGSTASASDKVRVPLVDVETTDGRNGRMAWWTGDLGVKADLSLDDAHAAKMPNATTPADGGYFRWLAAQQFEEELISGLEKIPSSEKRRMATSATASLTSANGKAWPRERFHDYAAGTLGVLADARDGGLKRDLGVYLHSEGQVSAAGGRPEIRDQTPILADAPRFREAGPTFGVLRSWANGSVPFKGEKVPTVNHQTDPDGGGKSELLALCNEKPARLKQRTAHGLRPILVEGSGMMQISTYIDRYSGSGTSQRPIFQVRQHNYPRVVLWNPYSVELVMDPVMVMIQGNGRQEVWTDNMLYTSQGKEMGFRSLAQWLFFEGGRSTNFTSQTGIMGSTGYNDPYMGSYYYSIPRTVFGPGECLVFSPARSAEYSGLSTYHQGSYDLSRNELSCEVAPDPSRSYYVSASEIGGGINFKPLEFWYQTTPAWSQGGRNGVENQVDDIRVVMKALTGTEPVTFERFDELPQLAYVSASLQYGAGREPRIAWDQTRRMPVELLDKARPAPRVVPDVRTREGIRLRWFDEHPSNLLNSGGLANQPRYMHEALLANWNPRAAYAVRSPWENIAGSLPKSGSGGGPWFFGAYTRDLYDEAVSWQSAAPVFRKGRYHGNPFGPPQEGMERYIVFDLPRSEVGVVSLAQFQHAPMSEMVWHPSFAIGNSLPDPRLGLDGLTGTVPPGASGLENERAGFVPEAIGWSSDSQRGASKEEWANMGRALLQDIPGKDHFVYDISYELNHALWDRFFIGTGTPETRRRFMEDPSANPLPNGRMRRRPGGDTDDINHIDRAAQRMMLAGAFNINSTRVEAWKALLGAARDAGDNATPYARLLNSPGGVVKHPQGQTGWTGARALTDDEIDMLAREIVVEVKTRGPFLGLSDFVNRRLAKDGTGKSGAIEAAIERAGLNQTFDSEYPLDNGESLGNYRHPDNIKDATRLEQTLKPSSKAWGAPGFLTQADVLQLIGPAISARSDTFVIRAYGESLDANGRVAARAWCEAVVQRFPDPVRADVDALDMADDDRKGDFGRRFDVVGFRWLRPEEI